jgi:hypothetical protein
MMNMYLFFLAYNLPFILEYAGDAVALETLKDFIPKHIYNEFTMRNKRTLIYGEVQSGKTAQIISIMKSIHHTCILLIQNSKLVRAQYMQRLAAANLQCQIITKQTTEINKPIVIVMNNIYQREKMMSIMKRNYSIICDEADVTHSNPLCDCAINSYYATATPYIKRFYKKFNSVVHIPNSPFYYGIQRLRIVPTPSKVELVHDFLATRSGILLINNYVRIADMITCALQFTRLVHDVPIILLTSRKFVYLHGNMVEIFTSNISKIIDGFSAYPHLIFIANRLSCRGLSYASTDHTRHITHQVSDYTNFKSFLQKSRICGIYSTNITLTLYIPDEVLHQVERVIQRLANFDAQKFLTVDPFDDRLHRIRCY